MIMEAMGAEGQWTSLSGVYTAEEADFMALLLNNQLSSVGATCQHLLPPQHYHHHHESTTIMNNNNNNNYCALELSSASSSSAYSGAANNSFINVFPLMSNNDHLSSDDIHNNVSHDQSTTHSFDFFDLAGDLKPSNHSDLVQGDHHRRRRGDYDDHHLSSEENVLSSGEACPAPRDDQKKKKIKACPNETSANKRPRSFEKVDQVGKKPAKYSKKKQKTAITRKTLGDVIDEEESGKNNIGPNNGHCSSSTTCYSGDESMNELGQETSGGDDSSLSPKDPHSDTKSRARRGSATDPQSLYARKRRERINERLRILQNLVPNGTKVDISTMLEEAVLYVKFLQLQIKLLSSDELWMYAPIAYNGKDIGLHHLKLSLANK